MTKQISTDTLQTYLHFGYIPQPEGFDVSLFPSEDLLVDAQRFASGKSDEALLREADRRLRNVYSRAIERHQGKKFVVPLSGGLDSRSIVAGLLRSGVDKTDIVTATYGDERVLDLKIARQVASSHSLEHVELNLSNHDFSIGKLRRFSAESFSWINLLGAYIYDLIPQFFGEESVYWSGFLAGTVSGQRYYPCGGLSWEEIRRTYLRKNILNLSELGIAESGLNLDSVLPLEPTLPLSLVNGYEQIELSSKQPYRIYPVIRGRISHLVAPYADPEWAALMMVIPNRLRSNQVFYRRFLEKNFSSWFIQPSTRALRPNNWVAVPRKLVSGLAKRVMPRLAKKGKSLSKSPLNTSFMDFESVIGEGSEFFEFVESKLCQLENASEESIRLNGSILRACFESGHLALRLRVLSALVYMEKA